MSQRRPLIAGNWKMNGTLADGTALAQGLVDKLGSAAHGFDMLVCPPSTLVSPICQVAGGSSLFAGGQDCHTAEKGAHTGDTSAAMLADLGCSHVILGHSERRADHGETDALVKAKAEAAHTADLIAIICVGETEAERDAGNTLDVVGGQLGASVPDGATGANTVIAYEPVWAIGTGRTATPEEAQEVHAFIREKLTTRFGDEGDAMRILYGGSMKPSNAEELLALKDVDGGLIGGASLNVDDFWTIAESCA
jgi:triosephosphate isomerase (TIM)